MALYYYNKVELILLGVCRVSQEYTKEVSDGDLMEMLVTASTLQYFTYCAVWYCATTATCNHCIAGMLVRAMHGLYLMYLNELWLEFGRVGARHKAVACLLDRP